MLPIRLGMLNATGPQELFVFLLTREGRVEAANYRTIAIPTDVELPLFVEEEFASFYSAMFDAAVARENQQAVFLEYAWDMSWCDPCAADPLSFEELRELGVFWILEQIQPVRPLPQPRGTFSPDVFVTRLHLRYDGEHFADDLHFREIGDRDNFQGRYVLRHPWRGDPLCEAARDYLRGLPERFEQQAQNLARLTRWPMDRIRSKMETTGQSFTPPKLPPASRLWWEKLWPDE
jgi:hypothetical protein